MAIRKIKHRMVAFGVMLALIAGVTPVHAIEDGAYLVGRTTSYADPATGSPVDGGTDIALGDSMCSSIVEPQILVEQVNGTLYVTMGLGLASNTEHIRILVNGQSVALTQTGSSSRNGDTVNHYRFVVGSLNDQISPIMYVAPMGRDVQFFVTLEAGNISAGTGVYQSLMIPATSDTPATKEEKKEEPPAEKVTDTTQEKNTEEKAEETKPKETKETNKEDGTYDPFEHVTGLSLHTIEETATASDSSIAPYVAAGGAVIAVLGGFGFWMWKKKGRTS